MSNQYYAIKWRTTINQLMEALQVELDPLKHNEQMGNLKLKRSDQDWFMYYGKLYIFYVDAYNALEDCYDQLVQPQKRTLLRQMVENCMLRIIEVKKNIIYYSTQGNVIRSDFVNLDPVLMEEKRIMQTLEVKLPRFFRDQYLRKREYRNQILDKLLMQFHDTNMPEEEVIDNKPILTNIEHSIRWIQRIERGRQGIERAYLAKHLHKQDVKNQEKKRRLQEGTEVAEETERDDAIQVIQKYYRGFKAREEIWNRRQQEMFFLGFQHEETEAQKERQREQEKRDAVKKVQKEHLKDYKTALQDAKEQLLANWTDEMKYINSLISRDNMLQERRDWYWSEVAKAEGKFVPPKAADFYKKENVRLPLTEEEIEQRDLEDKDRKAKKKDKGKKKKKKKKGDEGEEKREEQGPTETVVNIQQQVEDYTNNWDGKDEHQNFHQQHDPSLLNDEVAGDAEKHVRGMVDQMIDIELVNLRVALKAKKYKYPKDPDDVKGKGKRKKKKKKKAKGGRGGGGSAGGVKTKPEEDEEGEIQFKMRSPPSKKKKKLPGDKLTLRKDPRDMLAELIEAGIAKKLQPALISDLVGDAYPLRYKQEQLQEKVADPSMFDLRQVITQFVGMPLGSTFVKDRLKETNYYLFYGPPGSGKTHIVRALQTECNAIVLDLSPSNIENKYTDKPEYMLNLAFKVAVSFQPSIIYIDEVEKIFKGKKKKKKKGAPAGPPEPNFTKLRKFLLRYNKFYLEKEPENVAVIGCTSYPWEANKKQLKAFFKRTIYFPSPNYATRMKLLQHLFAQRNVTLHPSFPITSLAHVTEGFSAGNVQHLPHHPQIKAALDLVLSARRIALSGEIPYRLSEFLQPLSNQQSTFLSVYLKFRDLHDEFSGNKARIEKRNNPDGDDPKGKKKKKKKK